MKATYTNCDGNKANVSDAITASINGLLAVINKPSQIGTIDLFGELVTEESVSACTRVALHDIGRNLIRVSESLCA